MRTKKIITFLIVNFVMFNNNIVKIKYKIPKTVVKYSLKYIHSIQNTKYFRSLVFHDLKYV